jgi:hypothetical protein
VTQNLIRLIYKNIFLNKFLHYNLYQKKNSLIYLTNFKHTNSSKNKIVKNEKFKKLISYI